MITYKISFKNPHTHIIHIEAKFEEIKSEKAFVNLASWRPGRYEIANYAKNILSFNAFAIDGEALNSHKTTKDQWCIETHNISTIIIRYSYYAFQMDAGNSYLDEEQLYINPINCLVFIKERMTEACSIQIEVPDSYTIAIGLPKKNKNEFLATSFYELADSPFMASPNIQKLEYTAANIKFYIWIQGNNAIDVNRFLQDFKAFSEHQINWMGEFPEKEYHFLFQFLPYSFRHGVEHRNSTVITIGPTNKLDTELYNDLLGISSHELFHSWNVLKIRPRELSPYQFDQENYFKTGYIAEGLTTYYGDLLLARSRVYSVNQYLVEFNDLLKRHFETTGNFNMSVADSSFDLWLDGYGVGVPGRKVSIYVKGAVIAFVLDIEIRRLTENKKSLDDVMRSLWSHFGKKGVGYLEQDFYQLVKETAGVDLEKFLNTCIHTASDLKEEINKALNYLGMELKLIENVPSLEKDLGIKIVVSNGKQMVDYIDPTAPAIESISKNDEIIAINNRRFDSLDDISGPDLSITFFRNNKLKTVHLKNEGRKYNCKYAIAPLPKVTGVEKQNFSLWLDVNQKEGQ